MRYNFNKVAVWLVALVFVAITSFPALAHHSMAGFDSTKPVTLVGTVKQFKWANPHSWIEMEVEDGKGGTEVWNIEMTAPAQLIRAGWKSTTVKPGDKVKIVAFPQQSGEPGGLFRSITLPSGEVLTERAAAPAAPPATSK
jgi:hypothetical protein